MLIIFVKIKYTKNKNNFEICLFCFILQTIKARLFKLTKKTFKHLRKHKKHYNLIKINKIKN